MKRFIIAAALAAASAAALAEDLIVSDTPFTPEGQVSIEAGRTGETKVERGELNGVAYRAYYSDGSATFAGTVGNKAEPLEKRDTNWSVSCRKDKMTDHKSCALVFRDLFIIVPAKGTPLVSVGTDNFPGTNALIRIDGGKPVQAKGSSFSPKDSAAIVNALKTAKSITTRFVRWPSQAPVDSEWTPYGASEALAYCTWAAAHIR